jgi:(1->4)-alpha-D-glucan 1-alpha-D-glucosylmutase
MAFSHHNPFIYDILERGVHSRYARYFDIDWDHPSPNLNNKLLVPFLGQFYGQILEQGQLKISFNQGAFVAKYHDLLFPLSLESYPVLLSHRFDQLFLMDQEQNAIVEQLRSMFETISNMPSLTLPEQEDLRKDIQANLWELWHNEEKFGQWMEDTLNSINDYQQKAPVLLDSLFQKQHYQLAFWKTAVNELNYRRFFNINDLICLRIEEPEVFEAIHSFLLDLYKHGQITGFRVDHIDGLHNPKAYLHKLRHKAPEASIVVEKILDFKEALNPDWPVQGTTGYEFLNHVNQIFCCQEHRLRFDEITGELTDVQSICPESMLREQKAKVLDTELVAEIDNLAFSVQKCLSVTRNGRDIPLKTVREMIRLVFIFFPVYRTYVEREGCSSADLLIFKQTFEKIARHHPHLTWPLQCLEGYLTCQEPEFSREVRDNWLDCLLRLQQLTGPVMAKGFEDTFLYTFPRLLSLNEVGSHPPQFGHSLERFHTFMTERARIWPESMNALSTHDTKFGEDLRARLNCLSEIPEEWRIHILTWRQANLSHKQRVQGQTAPSRTDEYILYQVLLGVMPFDLKKTEELLVRLQEYAIKALREAKARSDWHEPNEDYEQAVCSFLSKIFASLDSQFFTSFRLFQKKVAFFGSINSLSQNLIRLTAPGVPDIYQGTEMWTLTLVDPDNRRPVDFQHRKHVLNNIKEESLKDRLPFLRKLLSSYHNGRVKLYQTWQTLWTRQKMIDLFQKGPYIPLHTTGVYKNHIIAFARCLHDQWILTIVPRFATRLSKPGEYPLGPVTWQDTAIVLDKGSPQKWQDVFTLKDIHINDNLLLVGDVLRHFPTALLISA